MARDDVLDRPKIKGDRLSRGALMPPGYGLDRSAQLGLIECARDFVELVAGGVAILLGAELVDEVVGSEMQVGNRREEGIEALHNGGQ